MTSCPPRDLLRYRSRPLLFRSRKRDPIVPNQKIQFKYSAVPVVSIPVHLHLPSSTSRTKHPSKSSPSNSSPSKSNPSKSTPSKSKSNPSKTQHPHLKPRESKTSHYLHATHHASPPSPFHPPRPPHRHNRQPHGPRLP